METGQKTTEEGSRQGLQWGLFVSAHAYYVLVACEFFYMVTPFAAYFYSVYGPGLELVADSPTWSWLNTFFLPHIVLETSSWFVNAHNVVGGTLFVGGLVGFALGAMQIYRNKLRKRAEVVGGMYAHVRHPQYLALIGASLGMVLIWPRFLVLLGFVTIVFVYFWLARTEERICLRRYAGYADYMKRTGMFLPRSGESLVTALPWPTSRLGRILGAGLLYAVALVGAGGLGSVLQKHAIESLYAIYTVDAAYLALRDEGRDRLARMVDVALNDSGVAAQLVAAGQGRGLRMLNYVLPAEFYVSEIPMRIPEGEVTGHGWPEVQEPDRYKIVFTRTVSRPGLPPSGIDIVRRAINKHPIVEVHVDVARGVVLGVFGPPPRAFYSGMPVPLY